MLAAVMLNLGAAADAAIIAPRSGTRLAWLPWLAFMAALVTASVAVEGLYMESFKAPHIAMVPTLHVGDHFAVDKLDRSVARGDVIVFRFPLGRDKTFVKRAVAIAGDRVAIRGGKLFVNGIATENGAAARPCDYEDHDEASGEVHRRSGACSDEVLDGRRYTIAHESRFASSRGDFPHDAEVFEVPQGSVFALGDNRENSHDSRYWGPVPLDDVLGKLLYVWWSTGEDGVRWDQLGQWVR